MNDLFPPGTGPLNDTPSSVDFGDYEYTYSHPNSWNAPMLRYKREARHIARNIRKTEGKCRMCAKADAEEIMKNKK